MTKARVNQKGQTLLIVIFVMSLGLLVMVNTASRVIASVARTTQTNYYQKATVAAEGGAEVFLAKPFVQLSDYLSGGSKACPPSKLINLSSSPTNCVIDTGESRAFMGVETYPTGTESLNIKSQPGETIHINLQNLDASVNVLKICWRGLNIKDFSASYYFLYHGSIGSYEVTKNLYRCRHDFGDTWCKNSIGASFGDIDEAPQADAGYSCYYIDLVPSQSVALRIFTFPDGAQYKIDALEWNGSTYTNKTFPQQGYRIISIGEVKSGAGASLESKKATRKKVTVEKTFSYPAGAWWDFAVTSVSGTVSP